MKKKVPAEVSKWFSQMAKRTAKARLEKISPERRSEIASIAGKAGGRGRPKKKAA